MRLADSHVHLERYAGGERAGLVRRAYEAGVEMLLAVSVSLGSARRSVALAHRWPGVYAAVGVHPRWLRGQSVAALERLAADPRVRAIGEVGLEYASAAAPAASQRAFLGQCLDLAERLDRAVVLHVVGAAAHADALALLAPRSGLRLVVHYFVGDERLAAGYLAVGCSISVGKPVGRTENVDLRTAVRQVPIDRLLLETDAYPLPGRTTEPRDLVAVCQTVAALRGETPAAVAQATTRNFRRLLRLPAA